MPSESVDHQSQHLAPPPQPAEPLPCPRCDSVNTKFCYYNNYNLSQPRHFCKSCRRYWTQGGTLRDVPVGGGSRKSSKRHRSSASAAATSSSSSSSSPSSVLIPHPTKSEPVPTGSPSDEPNPSLNPNLSGHECVTSGNGIGFTSLLNSHHSPGGGFLALGGFGLEEISGFGYGVTSNNNINSNKAVWPFHSEVGDFGVGVNGSNTWQMAIGGGTGGGGGSDGGLVDGNSSVDCFVWPDLSISMPGGNGLK